MRAVLDAWALLAYLLDESAADEVEVLLEAGEAGASWISLGEVYYTLARRHGHARAAAALGGLLQMLAPEEASSSVTMDAARIKAGGGLSYADAFAVATAERHRAPLYTGDPEIVALGRGVRVVDLRG